MDSSNIQELHIDRNSSSIIRDLFKKLKRKEIVPQNKLDVTFIGDEGIDAEGLTKEFFSIVMNSLKCGTGGYVLLEGSEDHLLPVISEEYHQSGYYNYVIHGEKYELSFFCYGFATRSSVVRHLIFNNG